MNKNFATILTTAALALAAGCVTAGTWVNGNYIDGPLCTVCDGMKFVTHAYGTTVCTHCDGTGIEPPENTIIVEDVIVDTWRPPLPPPHHRYRHPRPIIHHAPPHHGGGHRHEARPARPVGGGRPPQRTVRGSAPRQTFRPAARPSARPARPAGGHSRR